MPRRVERTRNMDTQTEAAFWGSFRSVLRKHWMMHSKARKACIDNARVGRGKYRCAMCGDLVGPKDHNVDHIKPCGGFQGFQQLGDWLEKLWVGVDGLRLLCKPCHNGITQAERKRAKQAKDMEHG